jgi:TRAP-type mannitol/chloroaromatic compound transport system substrate-binding protein
MEILVNQQYGAGTGDSYRFGGSLAVDGSITSGGTATLAPVTSRVVTGDVPVTAGNIATNVSTLGGVALAGATILGVVVRNVTALTAAGGTSYSVGDSATATKWGTTLPFTIDATTTSANFLAGTGATVAAATPIVLTLNAGTWTAGTVRVQAQILTIGAAPK